MLMISPTGKEVPIGQTLKPDEYIGMTRSSTIHNRTCQAYIHTLAALSAMNPGHGAQRTVRDRMWAKGWRCRTPRLEQGVSVLSEFAQGAHAGIRRMRNTRRRRRNRNGVASLFS